ncbi:MAG: riboflavin synthase [Ectothiorhodospiraceae bacterium]|nr:riboflavin synthase [Ectothiorhodospiraceae bacterium]
MFTGIVQALGSIRASESRGEDVRLVIATGSLPMADVQPGDSIAVNGVCLTAVELAADSFAADVSRETLDRTSLGGLSQGRRVNLEKALTLSTPLGGHLVSGHVDGLGEVLERRQDGRSWRFLFRAPARLARYIAEKGSICIDGTSLTVNGVDGAEFHVNIVPHTMDATIMGEYRPGRKVNLEVDLIARYLERLVLGDQAAVPGQGITREFLARHGFRAD